MNMKSGEEVYAIYNDVRVHALTSYGMMPIEDIPKVTNTTKTIPKDAYVYLQYLNVIEGIRHEVNPSQMHVRKTSSIHSMTEISHLFKGKNKIYSNGGSEIYK